MRVTKKVGPGHEDERGRFGGAMRRAETRRAMTRGVSLWLLAAVLAAGGCNDRERSVGQRVRHHVVQTVVDQGVTLNRGADPREVVYVLLCAIRDDYAAGDDPAAREAAFDRELAVCAPDYMYFRAFRRSVGRDDAVQRIVWHWAPTLGHYRADFPADWESASKRLVVARTSTTPGPEGETEQARVMIELASPSGDPNASVVGQFQLVREKGYWRIAQVGFVKGIRHLTAGILERFAQGSRNDSG